MSVLRAISQRANHLGISLLIVAVFAAGFVLGSNQTVSYAQSDTAAPPGAVELFQPFWQVYNLILSDYLNDVEPNTLMEGALNGMIDTLGDQFSGYMNPEIYALMNADLSGQVEGIGAIVRTNEDTNEIEIVNVLDGAPAEAAGVKSGDVFVAVDGEDVTGWTQLELVGRVRGRAGTDVTITFRRGEELIDITITRARITVPNVESRMLDSNIGYIKLRDFNSDARNQLDAALQELDVNNLDGLVFDLRGNPGGLLTSAIDIASAFIKNGVILTEDFGQGSERVYEANGSYIGVSVPLVVLVDENSASASELVAGALQDRGRATIVGEVTFGKGTVQTWRELVNGGGVRLTIARWLTPDGHWIHEQGVTPDVLVEWTPEDHTANPDADPQLDAAVQFLQTGVAAPQ
ncbi:MAG: S41 family peptidase [Anaerolineaceae bacterium]|nr:S41 family peptidase [Anaerolineaceae bacterium]